MHSRSKKTTPWTVCPLFDGKTIHETQEMTRTKALFRAASSVRGWPVRFPRLAERNNLVASVALVCTANRCRSVMAHAIFVDEAKKRSLDVDVYSAGVVDFSDMPPLVETTRMCLQYNTPAPDKAPTWVRELPWNQLRDSL